MSTLINEFLNEINNNKNKFVGDLLEFGTGSGSSTKTIAENLKDVKIFTFDGFVGLPKTKKVVPKGTPWNEGDLKFNESQTRELLKEFENVFITKTMTWELKPPSDYGIKEISSVNIDLDLYEGTLDALYFMDKCEWTNVLVRFDDWGYYKNTSQIKEEVEEHEKAAFFDFVNDKKYNYTFYENYNILSEYKQVIVEINR
jgi:hypothetical protein